MLIVLRLTRNIKFLFPLKTKLRLDLVLEAIFIALGKPALNDQLVHFSLSLFRHDIT